MNSDDSHLWDRAAAIRTMADDATVARQLFAMLVDSLPGECESMRRFQQLGDWQGLGQTAHRLKGSSRLCCSPALEQLMLALEQAVASGQIDRVGELLASFEVLAEGLRIRLEAADAAG